MTKAWKPYAHIEIQGPGVKKAIKIDVVNREKKLMISKMLDSVKYYININILALYPICPHLLRLISTRRIIHGKIRWYNHT